MTSEHEHTNAYICSCGYGLGEYHWETFTCPAKCGIADSVIVRHEGSPYYGPTWCCTNCGDSWSDGYLGERPFGDRYWRHKAIEHAAALFERACDCTVERDDDFAAVMQAVAG